MILSGRKVPYAVIAENLRQVRQKIARAAARAGRDPEQVKLVAVTKTVTPERILPVLEEGVYDLGENRAQELLKKYTQLPSEVNWHFIGHLQTNKVKKLIALVKLFHSLDRWSLAVEIDKHARQNNIIVDVLLQVNVSGEKTKFGLAPEEVKDFAAETKNLSGIKVRGLMTMAPYTDDPEEVRPVFRNLRLLADNIGKKVPSITMDLLSMGMTNDYEIAVEEGASVVRVGTAIFGERVY